MTIEMTDPQALIDKYYPADSPLRDIYLSHVRNVAAKALDISHRLGLAISDDMVRGAALTHDIGVFLTDAPGIHCFGTEPYIRHGILGAELLRSEGAPEEWTRVAERHTGTGITAEQIAQLNLPLPPGDYMPRTQLERLICYSDKFFSKTRPDTEKSLEQVRRSMSKISEETLARFDELHKEFG